MSKIYSESVLKLYNLGNIAKFRSLSEISHGVEMALLKCGVLRILNIIAERIQGLGNKLHDKVKMPMTAWNSRRGCSAGHEMSRRYFVCRNTITDFRPVDY